MSLLQLFQPSNSFDRKNCAAGVLRYGFGRQQPRLVICGTLISGLGTKVCLNEHIFHAQKEEKINKHLWLKFFLSSLMGEN